jgi:hypothetical protein
MTAETWSNLVRVYYKLSNDNAYTGKLLVKALSSNKHRNLNQQMQIVDVMNVPSDHIGIFRDKYRPRGQAFVYCFYATSRGGIPIKTEGIWFNSIDTATDLLSKVITRSENKYFSDKVVVGLAQETDVTEQKPKRKHMLHASECNKRISQSPNTVSTIPPSPLPAPTPQSVLTLKRRKQCCKQWHGRWG